MLRVIVNDDKQVKAWLWSYFKRSWLKIIVLSSFAILGVGLDLLNPFPLKLLADSVFGIVPAPGPLAPYSQTFTLLLIIAGFYVTMYLLQSGLDFLSSYIGARFNFQLDLDVKKQFFGHLMYLPVKASQRLEDEDYSYRLNQETSVIPGLVLETSVTILQSAVTIIGVLVILLLIDWQMTLISLLVVPLLYLSVMFFGSRLEAKSHQVEEATSDTYTHTGESIHNSEVIQSFNRQQGQIDKLVQLLKKRLRLELDYTKLSSAFGFSNSLLTVLAIVFIVIIGGRNVFAGRITFGDLLIFVTYAGFLFDPLQTLSSAIASAKDSMAAVKRVFAVINSYAEIENTQGGKVLSYARGQIVFQNVSFSDGGRSILKNISLRIEPGQRVAFIGPSGSGKTTVLRLVGRFLIPDNGFIYIDGNEIHDINLKSLRDQIAIVTQEPKLFSVSVAENIGFARPVEQYPLPEVMAAAEAAYANEFIEKLPEKFSANLKQAGDSLSGGQKQRLAIARAFFKNAPILLLDEPTSAQDVASEKHVLDGINRLMEGKTVLMVTHKLSLLYQMDAVYVIENGRVANIKQYGGIDAYTRYLQVHEMP